VFIVAVTVIYPDQLSLLFLVEHDYQIVGQLIITELGDGGVQAVAA